MGSLNVHSVSIGKSVHSLLSQCQNLQVKKPLISDFYDIQRPFTERMEAGFVSMRSKVERFPKIDAIHCHKSMELMLDIKEEKKMEVKPWVTSFTERLGRKLPALDLKSRKEPVNVLLFASMPRLSKQISRLK